MISLVWINRGRATGLLVLRIFLLRERRHGGRD